MGIIESPKTYTGRDLETIFFRPMLNNENAERLGIRMMYNMPVPTTIQLWSPQSDILQDYSSGWTGGNTAQRKTKTIGMMKVKAEVGFSASEYAQEIYELITGRADVNFDDLTGTELEQAETEMFRRAIAESLRVMMWVGNTEAETYNKFDGFLTLMHRYAETSNVPTADCSTLRVTPDNVLEMFNKMWNSAPPQLKALKAEGNLALFVTSDLYDAYELYLDSMGADGAYTDLLSGRRELSYHGIKIIDMGISQYLPLENSTSMTQCLLTDRRNLIMAVNTADYPGSEVRMWYNPDQMENRQRAIFMVGCEILDEELIVRGVFC